MELEYIEDNKYLIQEYLKAKDYIKSPFRYPGGKFYALKHILPFINYIPHDEYREPFVGGGSVFFGKNKSSINWINDLEINLIEVYKAFCDHSFIERLKLKLENEIATPDRHAIIKNSSPIDLFDKIYRIYYLNRTSYSGIIHKPAWGYKEGKSSPPINWIKFVENAFKKLENVEITSLDFEEVIAASPKGDSVMIYLDPPYFKADQKRAYTKSFRLDDHLRLNKILQKTQHNFCLSYDNCNEIKELYSWAFIYEKQWLYNTANKKGTQRTLGNELIITNYEVKFDLDFTCTS